MNPLKTALAVSVLVGAATLLTDARPIAAQDSARVCFSKPGPAGTFVVYAPTAEQASLESKGFVQIPCDDRENQIALYRTRICQLANTASDQSLSQFEQSYGVNPKDLCRFAGGEVGGD